MPQEQIAKVLSYYLPEGDESLKWNKIKTKTNILFQYLLNHPDIKQEIKDDIFDFKMDIDAIENIYSIRENGLLKVNRN